jgi:hypothetical protein
MSFFGDIVPEPGERRSHRHWERPDAAFPGVVATTIELVHAEQVAIAVAGIWAFATGFEFSVAVRLRSIDRALTFIDAPIVTLDDGESLHDEFLRFGVQFSNGEKVTNIRGVSVRDQYSEPARPVLSMLAAGAGRRSRDFRYWVWPLPPVGEVTFVCEWPALHIPESRGSIDGRLILEAAAASVQLWPE